MKYLLLLQPEEEFPEQINSYMFLVMEIILLAKETGRVFVLPHLHSQPRNNALAESGEDDHRKFVLGKIYIPMERLFDQHLLSKYVKTIEFKDYLVISKQRVSTLCRFKSLHNHLIDSYGEKLYCDDSLLVRHIDEVKKLDDPFVAITGYKRGMFLIKSSPNWPAERQEDYWKIRSHLKYHSRLEVKADEFRRKKELGKYLAVHWRRGDRVHPEMKSVAEEIVTDDYLMRRRIDEYLIEPIKKTMHDNKLTRVFLATNSGTKWHLNYLRSRLPISMYPPARSWRKREENSFVEQIICSKANYFFSSPFNYQRCSSFARWIIDARILSGKGDSVSYQIKMGTKGEGPVRKPNVLARLRHKLISKSGSLLKKSQIATSDVTKYITHQRDRGKTIRGLLFDQRPVKLDSRSLKMGGAWFPSGQNQLAKTHHPEVLKAFYEGLKMCKAPILYDIGASSGSFSLLAKLIPKLKVYSFEPQSEVYKILRKNVELNGLTSRVTTFEIALMDKEAFLTLHIPKVRLKSGLATFGTPKRFENGKVLEAEVSTLDIFHRQFYMPDPTHVKIDTEGAEWFVLIGGQQLITRARPIILLECTDRNTAQFGYASSKITSLLTSWGYTLKFISDEDLLCHPK